jgi:hypothetical protein
LKVLKIDNSILTKIPSLEHFYSYFFPNLIYLSLANI